MWRTELYIFLSPGFKFLGFEAAAHGSDEFSADRWVYVEFFRFGGHRGIEGLVDGVLSFAQDAGPMDLDLSLSHS